MLSLKRHSNSLTTLTLEDGREIRIVNELPTKLHIEAPRTITIVREEAKIKKAS